MFCFVFFGFHLYPCILEVSVSMVGFSSSAAWFISWFLVYFLCPWLGSRPLLHGLSVCSVHIWFLICLVSPSMLVSWFVYHPVMGLPCS